MAWCSGGVKAAPAELLSPKDMMTHGSDHDILTPYSFLSQIFLHLGGKPIVMCVEMQT